MISNNIVGYCFPNRNIDKTSPFDIGEFLTRILLFDKVFLKSIRLKEVSFLAERIGAEQTIELIESGILKFIVDSLNLASTGQNSIIKSSRDRGGPLPLGSYCFQSIILHYGKEETSKILPNVRPQNKFLEKQVFKKLKLSVAENILSSPDKVRYSAMDAINSDIKHNIVVIPHLISKDLAENNQMVDINGYEIKVKTHELSPGDFKIETNLNSLLGFSIEEEHKVVQRALLSLGSFNQALLEMEAYNAVTIFDDEDSALFDQKYKFIVNQLDEHYVHSELSRIVKIIGLPDFSQTGVKYKINIEKLLKVKQSDEFLLFRNFLKNSNKFNDKELEGLFKSLKVKIAEASNAPLGKTARLLFGAGLGLIPFIGTPLGLAVSAADQYLFEKIMPSKGVISFINRGYPSIFKKI